MTETKLMKAALTVAMLYVLARRKLDKIYNGGNSHQKRS